MKNEINKRGLVIAVILTTMLPGWGHVYLSKIKKGFLLIFSFILIRLSLRFGFFGNSALMYLSFNVLAILFVLYTYINLYLGFKKSNLLACSRVYKYLSLFIFCFSLLLFNFVLPNTSNHFAVNSSHMSSALEDGDMLYIKKKQVVDVGDIVVCEVGSAKKNVLSRIIAKSGDEFEVKDYRVFVNGVDLGQNSAKSIKKVILLNEQYLYLSDNLDDSINSRHLGLVLESEIVGVVQFVYFTKKLSNFFKRFNATLVK